MPNRTADYIARWVSGAKNVYNLDINYVGVSVDVHVFLIMWVLQALSIPYCQSTWMSVCCYKAMSMFLRLNISETYGDNELFHIGSLYESA